MIKLIGFSLFVLLIVAGISPNITDAVASEKYDVSKYVKETVKKPYPGKNGLWIYQLWVCPKDYSIAIAEVMLNSDTETQYLGVNKAIVKGECSTYGAVMKAKNGNSLNYKITTMAEAADKIVNSKMGKLDGTNWNEIMRYKFITGYY